MEKLADTKIINQMLSVEKNACQIIEDAKKEGNRLIAEARSEVKRIIEKTKQELDNNFNTLQKKLQEKAEREVGRIKAENLNALEMIEKQTTLKRELAIKKIRKFLFKQIMDDLC